MFEHPTHATRPVVRRIVLVAAALLATACQSSDCPEGEPAISALSADKTEVAAGGDVTLTIAVSNFSMTGHHDDGHDEEHHDEGCGNSGHAHVYLDSIEGELLGMALEASITVAIPDGTTAGPHKLVAQLQDVNHKPVEPKVTRDVAITVK